MLDSDQNASYWKQTIINACVSLVLFLAMISFILVSYGPFNSYQFLGFPLGVFALVLLGSIFAIVFVVRHCVVQDNIDARFGANEDI